MLSWLLSDTTYYLGGVLFAIVGLYLLITGWRGKRPKKPTCRKCRYDMSAATSLTCSECGCVHRNAGYLWRAKARKIRFVLGLLLVGFVYYAHAWPEVKWRQWTLGEPWYKSIVPTAAWIVALPKLEDEDWKLVSVRLSETPGDESRYFIFTNQTFVGRYRSATRLFDDDGDGLGRMVEDINLPRWELWLLMRSCDAILKDAAVSDERRSIAIKWVAGASSKVDSAVNPLCTALVDADRDIRFHAIWTLRTIKGRAAPAIPLLIAQLNDPDFEIIYQSAITLLAIGSELDAKHGDLFTAYQSVRSSLASLLEASDHFNNFLEQTFDESTRAHLIADPVFPRLAVLRALLVEPPPTGWGQATAKAISNDWSRWADLMPFLLARWLNTESGHKGDFINAVNMIGRVRPEDEAHLSELIAGASERNRKLLVSLTHWFTAPATDFLCLLARDPGIDLSDAALSALHNIKQLRSETIQFMASTVFNHADRTRWTVVDLLSNVEEASQGLLWVLEAHVNDPRRRARDLAVAGLRRWAPKRCIELLSKRAGSQEAEVRSEVCQYFESLGTIAAEALPLLNDMAAKDDQPPVQQAAKQAIAAIESALELEKEAKAPVPSPLIPVP